MAAVSGKKVDAVIAAINKKAGKAVVNRLGKIKDQFKTEFIPTPSLKINIDLGGGFKRGAISETAGEISSGKTSFWLEIIALIHENHPTAICHWLETEGDFDWDYAVGVHGIDPDRLVVKELDDEGAEASLDVLEALLRTGEIYLIVVNSLAGLTPKKEFTDKMIDQSVALQARMMSKLMRKIVGITRKTKTHVSFINQFREMIITKGDPRKTTGGRALSYFATQRLDFTKVKIEAADGFTEQEAVKLAYRIRKNRCVFRNPYLQGTIIAIFGEGIDQVGEIARLAPTLGICEKGGSWIHYPTKAAPATIDGTLMKFQSAALFMKFLEGNDAARKMFFDEVMLRLDDAAKLVSESMDVEDIDGVQKEEKEAKDFLSGVEAIDETDEDAIAASLKEGEEV